MDSDCDRVGMGVFAEPLNAVSNVSFLLAALAAWVQGPTRGHSFDRSPRADCFGGLRRYREHPVAHGPEYVDADSR